MSRPFFFYGAEERPRSRGRHGRGWLCVPESEQKTFLFREKSVQTALALGDGFKLVFPCGGGDGVFQSGRRQVDDFLPQRRGYDGFFLGDEIAAFFQRLNDIGAGGFGSEALAFLERGFRLTVLDQKMDVGHGVNQAPLAES